MHGVGRTAEYNIFGKYWKYRKQNFFESSVKKTLKYKIGQIP
jgi:hypothetical protein